MRKNLFLIVFVLIASIVSAQEYIAENPEIVTVFPCGTNEGQLGYNDIDEFCGPRAFCFNSNKELVINDYVNERICIFNQDFVFLKSIKLDNYMVGNRIEVNSDNFISYYGYTGIQKFNKEGYTVFKIDLRHSKLFHDIRSDGLYTVGDVVFGYKDDGELFGFDNLSSSSITNNKRDPLTAQQIINKLEKYSNNLRIEKGVFDNRQLLSKSVSEVPERSEYSNEYIIYKDGQLLSRDFETIQKVRTVTKELYSVSINNDLLDLYNKHKDIKNKIFYGEDKSENQYFRMREYIFVLNSRGLPIKSIKCVDRDNITSGYVLSDEGDIYYLNSTEDGHYLYRFKRDW
ncbi:MAG: hypothetical protein PQJ46_06815 [Spirochaetales bacterium]|nr:hypothetical protein [Spirochaetales bacterium]